MKLCRHCQKHKVNRPRGLCWSCYYLPGIRDRFPSESKYGQRPIDDFCGRAKLPPAPTGALPGSPEKIAILSQRAQARQSLWHPLDANMSRRASAALLAEVG